MKKILIISFVLCVLFISMNCFALNDGLYNGVFKICVDNPTQCAPNTPGNVRIINLEANQVIYQNILIWMGQEIVLSEKTCAIYGNAILCPPVDQILDMSVYGFDAIVYNKSSHGAGVIGEDNFTIYNSVKKNICEGPDCDIIAEWMLGEGASFPCNIGPWISEFTLVE